MYSFYESSRSKKFGRTSANMYLQFKWDMENYATHRYNVKTAKPSIDNSAPRTFTHMYIRPKKLQLELERYSTIQRNNRFLLERLATICREGAWIDNKNYHEIKSLNTWKRQQEMISLAHNNQIMLARLHDVGAGLNRHKLEDEYLMNQKYKANILKYPPNWREIQEHLVHLKKETFKKVFDSKYQKREYEKSRKKVLKRWATEREKHKAEKLAQVLIPDERKEALMKKGKGDTVKGQKNTLERALENSSRPENGTSEKPKFDRKQKSETVKKTSINGKTDAQKKVQPTQWKKPQSERARDSTSKTNNVVNKEEIGRKPIKARTGGSSTGFNFKGDGKSEKYEISDEDKQTESSENSQDHQNVSKEENEPFDLNKKNYDDGDERTDFSTPSESSKKSDSKDGILSSISEDSKQFKESGESGSEKDTMENYYSVFSQEEDEASDLFEDGSETTDEKIDNDTEMSVSSDRSDSDKNSETEKGNTNIADQSSYDTSDKRDDSKEADES